MLPKHARVGVPPLPARTHFRRTEGRSLLKSDFSFPVLSDLTLKEHHEKRPLWVSEEGRIYVETFSPWYQAAQEFLVAIAEPCSRPTWIHEYQLTPYALYAGTSIGLQTDLILTVLERLSK
jgi:hypothetical protein